MSAKGIRRLVQIALAIGLIAVLVTAADWRSVLRALADLRPVPLICACGLFLPQTLVSAWRWRGWCRSVAAISTVEAIRQTLATAALNLVVPSKAGEVAKAAMLPGLDASGRACAAWLAVLEKLADVAVLAAILLIVRLVPADELTRIATCWAGTTLVGVVVTHPHRIYQLRPAGLLLAWTVVLWCLHLWQISLFVRAAGVDLPWEVVWARVPVAIFVGLLPVSFCGIGTRDAALVWLFEGLAPAGAMTVVGLLTALRYLIPGAAGILVVGRYLPVLRLTRTSPPVVPA